MPPVRNTRHSEYRTEERRTERIEVNAPNSDTTLRGSSPTITDDERRQPRLITRELVTKRGRGKKRPREDDEKVLGGRLKD
ncbi:hypothetical protein ACEPAF_979 [Sanghuangporus sanghuang]